MFIVYYIWQPGSCDSEYPYHLSATSLPDQNNSLNVDLCMSDRGGKSRITYCCAEKINVTVHNCFGEYFVYKLNERMESNAYGKVCLSESKTGSKFIHMPLVISSYGGSHAAIYGCFGMSTVWQQWDKIYLLCKHLNSRPFYSKSMFWRLMLWNCLLLSQERKTFSTMV